MNSTPADDAARAQAAKAMLENDSVRQLAAQKAALDAVALEKARTELRQAQADARTTELTNLQTHLQNLVGAMPKFSELPRGSVALPPGEVFRIAQVSGDASKAALKQINEDINKYMASGERKQAQSLTEPSQATVLLTSDTELFGTMFAAREVLDTAARLIATIHEVVKEFDELEAGVVAKGHFVRIDDANTAARGRQSIVAMDIPAVVEAAADVAGALVTGAVGVFAVDAAVVSKGIEATSLETHAKFLSFEHGSIRYIYDSFRPALSNVLLALVTHDLPAADFGLRGLRAAWATAQSAATAGSPKASKLSAAVAQADALIGEVDAFLIAIHTAPPGGGTSPFAGAATRAALFTGEIDYVLWMPAVKVTSDQVIFKRLFKNPSVYVRAVARVPYFLVGSKEMGIRRAGVAECVVAYNGLFRYWRGLSWRREPAS